MAMSSFVCCGKALPHEPEATARRPEAFPLETKPAGPPVPPADRPDWLQKRGPGQANVEPTSWTISICDWLKFVDACRATTTWEALAAGKGDTGESGINTYDLNDHFVKPWTRGTGNSIALLMNPKPKPAELMLSHAWAGVERGLVALPISLEVR